MNIRIKRNRGLAMIGLLILVGAILIIAGTIVYMLWRLCQRLLPPTPPPAGTNQVNYVEFTQSQPIVMPNFVFAPIESLPNATAERPLGDALLEVDRSTNMVDWTPLIRTNADHGFNMFVDDTNPPAPAAFYRMKVIVP